jgi:hypothetical protein
MKYSVDKYINGYISYVTTSTLQKYNNMEAARISYLAFGLIAITNEQMNLHM